MIPFKSLIDYFISFDYSKEKGERRKKRKSVIVRITTREIMYIRAK